MNPAGNFDWLLTPCKCIATYTYTTMYVAIAYLHLKLDAGEPLYQHSIEDAQLVSTCKYIIVILTDEYILVNIIRTFTSSVSYSICCKFSTVVPTSPTWVLLCNETFKGIHICTQYALVMEIF